MKNRAAQTDVDGENNFINLFNGWGFRQISAVVGAFFVLMYLLATPLSVALPVLWQLCMLIIGLILLVVSTANTPPMLVAKWGALVGVLVVAAVMARAGAVISFSGKEWLALILTVAAWFGIGGIVASGFKANRAAGAALGLMAVVIGVSATAGLKNGVTDVVVNSRYLEMRDGVKIAVSSWLPRTIPNNERIPTILQQTRYHRAQGYGFPFNLFSGEVNALLGLQTGPSRLITPMVREGYAYVTVDGRGSGASFGSRYMDLSPEEVRDGAEVVDWIIAQDWSNGNVGATGVSYTGTTSEFLASNQHPAVKAVMPKFALYDTYTEVLFPGGIRSERFFRVWNDLNEHLDNNTIDEFFGPLVDFMNLGIVRADEDGNGEMLEAAIREHQNNYSIYDATQKIDYRDDVVGDLSTDKKSSYYYRDEIRASGIPVYSISGWYDGGYAYGAVRRYLNTPNPGSKLMLGPWDHGGDQMVSPCDEDPNELLDYEATALRFFDKYLKGKDTGVERDPPVRYFTMCAGEWREEQSWPPAAEETLFYFAADNALSQVAPASDHASDNYQIDLTATSGKQSRWVSYVNLDGARIGYPDRAEQGEKLLVYESSPLDRDLEITGHPIVTLYIAADRDDAHVYVYLEEVSPEGDVRYVTEGQLRALHRNLNDEAAPFVQPTPYRSFLKEDAARLEPGVPTELKFDLWPVSYLVKKNHRLRVAIAGADMDNFVQFHDGASELEIHRSRTLASHIVLPIVERP